SRDPTPDLAFSPDSSRVAEVRHPAFLRTGPTSQAVLWNADGKMRTMFLPIPALRHHIAFSPDGKKLLTWGRERNSVGQIRNAATGTLMRTMKGKVASVAAVAFNGD